MDYMISKDADKKMCFGTATADPALFKKWGNAKLFYLDRCAFFPEKGVQ
jgi:hypothetical protein